MMEKGKIFSVSSILTKKEGMMPVKRELSGKFSEGNSKDKLKKNRKIHLEKIRMEISQHLLKQYIKDINYQSHQKMKAKEVNSLDKVQNYWENKLSSIPKDKQKEQNNELQIFNRRLLPKVKDSKSIYDRKAKAKFWSESFDGLNESEIISGAKKMIDNKNINKRYKDSEEGRKEHKVKINGSRIYEGRIGPWKFQEEAMLDFYS